MENKSNLEPLPHELGFSYYCYAVRDIEDSFFAESLKEFEDGKDNLNLITEN